MAIVEVKVPQLSESVAEATLLKWKKKPGAAVAMDEILIEIETDKVVMEVPAPAAGVLTEVVVADGGDFLSVARVSLSGGSYLDPGSLGCMGVGKAHGRSKYTIRPIRTVRWWVPACSLQTTRPWRAPLVCMPVVSSVQKTWARQLMKRCRTCRPCWM
jgi:hypothetical protein